MISVSVLSEKDVERLLNDPSAETRAATVRKVASVLNVPKLNAEERKLALDVFAIMARDAEVRVRRALSESIRSNPAVPRELVKQLAGDIGEVAVPVLQVSSVLTDDDLVEIIAAGSNDHHMAIAGRASVSETVSGALIERGTEQVVSRLLENDGAKVKETSFERALERFPGSGPVSDAMAGRKHLPMAVAQRLVDRVSEKLRLHLVTHHDLPSDIATDLVLDSRERAIVGLASDNHEPRDLGALVGELKRTGRLTSTLLLRALYTGDLDFFAFSLASIADISVGNARRLIHDPGRLGLKALYQRCGLPERMLPLARVAIAVASEMQYDGGPADRARFVERAIERLLTHFDGVVPEDDVDWLISRLGRARSEAVRATHFAAAM